MIFGGSSARYPHPRPEGSRPVTSGSAVWRVGDGPAQSVISPGMQRRVAVLGWCGATKPELHRLTGGRLPDDVAWRWPGTYTVVEEIEDGMVIHTDPAAAQPVYATRHEDRWVWSTSARLLAALAGGGIDRQRLACAVFLPSVPALTGRRTFFTRVDQLPPGHRIEVPADGGPLRTIPAWRPDPLPGPPDRRLRRALTAAVSLRASADPNLSCDMSGGLDSTSITALAAELPDEHPVNAVTVHPEDDLSGADLRYARQAATAFPNRITHHLMPLTAIHLPYTAITAAPPGDEPAPSTITQARLTAQLDWMTGRFGTRTHLTGDGGDSLLFQPPIHLADLVRHGHYRRTVREAGGWARLRHTPIGPILRDAMRTARTGRTEALATLADSVGAPDRDDHGRVSWFPLLPFPAWADPDSRRLLATAAGRAATMADPLPGLDASVRVLVDEIREVARTAAADATLARARGVALHNPFLDASVVDAVLRTPIDLRPAVHAYKPVLGRALADLLPAEVASRTTKGSFDADHYTGMRANLPDLLTLATGHLAEYGLIRPGTFRVALRQAAAGIPMSLAAIEQALAAEVWLTAHHQSPAPAWDLDQVRAS